MEEQLVLKKLKVRGMTCSGCERRIEKRLQKINGIIAVKANYGSSIVNVTYDKSVVTIKEIAGTIEQLDYQVVRNSSGPKESLKSKHESLPISHLLGIGIVIFAIYEIIKNTIGFNYIPQINKSMGFGILFVIGLITSIHCIAMCGGINLSQCMAKPGESDPRDGLSKLTPSLLYNLGRVISYTIIGGIVGALGSVVSFSGTAKGIVAIVAGAFMIIMGLNMLSIFPWLKRINIRPPRQLGFLVEKNSKQGPLFVGLLNGLMPCGPLQAMQLYALGTGSFLAGATAMLIFSLGTVPLMFGFGVISSLLSGKFNHWAMKASAVLVIVLGVLMFSRGLNLSGVAAYAASGPGNVAKIQGNLQAVETTMDTGRYSPIVVQKGIPVVWTIKARGQNLNGCNEQLTIPSYNIQKKLVPGDNVIKFTPATEGTIAYTCWMGMISSTISVIPDLSKISSTDIQNLNQTPSSPPPGSQGSSGLSGGGCCGTPRPINKNASDAIKVAQIKNNTQEVTVNVDVQGYTPAIVVLQKGVPFKIKFNVVQLDGCNNAVVFPEYQGALNLQQGQTETPSLTAEQDFTFKCGMGMLRGYAKVVDDINKVDLQKIRNEVKF